jgi:hypothetical protein
MRNLQLLQRDIHHAEGALFEVEGQKIRSLGRLLGNTSTELQATCHILSEGVDVLVEVSYLTLSMSWMTF